MVPCLERSRGLIGAGLKTRGLIGGLETRGLVGGLETRNRRIALRHAGQGRATPVTRRSPGRHGPPADRTDHLNNVGLRPTPPLRRQPGPPRPPPPPPPPPARPA